MYDRNVGERTLTFHVSGALNQHSLVMRDLETGTLWGHLHGEGKQGPELHTQLEVIPSVLTDWRQWKATYPDSRIMMLSPTHDPVTTKMYSDGTRYGLGYAEGDAAKLWTFAGLSQQPLLNESIAGKPFVIWFDEPSGGGWGWHRELDGNLLSFQLVDGVILDTQTKSTWDLVRGRAIEGQLVGRQLTAVPLIPSLKNAWVRFYTDSTIWPDN